MQRLACPACKQTLRDNTADSVWLTGVDLPIKFAGIEIICSHSNIQMHRLASSFLLSLREPFQPIVSRVTSKRLPATTFWLTPNAKVTSVIAQCGHIATRNMITHQVRKYAPIKGDAPLRNANPCWNCKEPCGQEQLIFCDACGYMQDVNKEINYFELMNFPENFALERQNLTQRFRQLQSLVHPDKYSQKTEREQINSAEWSALINKAYKTLSVPLERGQYILKLQGVHMPKDNSVLNKQFLMEMMERNEEVDEAITQEALLELNARVTNELDQIAEELRVQFDANALEAAKMLLVKMKYLASIQKTIKNKLQRLMGS